MPKDVMCLECGVNPQQNKSSLCWRCMEAKYKKDSCPDCELLKQKTSERCRREVYDVVREERLQEQRDRYLAQRKQSYNSITQRRYYLLRRYGLSEEQWEAMFESQDFVCAICKSDRPGGKGWHTDHKHGCYEDHTPEKACSKCIRGITCHRCNIYLISALESPLLKKAIQYLEFPPAQKHLEKSKSMEE